MAQNIEDSEIPKSASYKYCAVNKNPFFRLDFDWTIENFIEDLSSCHESPEIQLPDGKTWNFVCKTRPDYRGDIFIRNNSNSRMFVKGTWSNNSRERKIRKKIAPASETKVDHDPIMKLYNPVFRFRLKIYGLMKKQCIYNLENPLRDLNNPDRYRISILNHFQKSLKNRELSDVRIQVGRKTIHANKFVVSAMSPVFAAMFRNPTAENKKGVVKVTDVSFDVLEMGVGFMYGKFPDEETLRGDWDKLCELYYMSDKYQVLDLREICGRALLKKMTVENVWKLVDLSDRHSDPELLKQVGNFCCIHYDDVVKTEGWKNLILKNPLSACIVMEQYTNLNQ